MTVVSRFAVLFVTYAIGVALCRTLLYGRPELDGATAVAMVAVPIVQTAVLGGWRWLRGRRRSS